MSDFGFDLGFRTAVINSVEQENLAMFERRTRRTRTVPMPRPIRSILQQFIREKMHDADAMRELGAVLRDLVYGLKHPEFRPELERLEAQIGEYEADKHCAALKAS